MRPTLYTVRPGAGFVSTMAKPRAGDWLTDEMAALRDAGVGVLVSALTAGEAAEVALTGEPQAAQDAGLRFVSIPIPDRGVPDPGGVLPDLHRLAAEVRAGGHVVAHCRFGIGRSSLLAAAVLVLNGLPADEAWAALRQARGLPVPDTAEQRAWPGRLVEHHGR